MNWSSISRNVGIALLFSAAFMFISAGVSVYYHLDASFAALFLSGVITLAVGIFPLIFVRKGSVAMSIKDGYVTIVLAWLLSCIFGMIPYVIWGGEFSIINAWYESVSGYTTTGSSILNDIDSLPRSLLFWRASTNYIGGLGVVVFMLLILPSTRAGYGVKLSRVEISSLSKENYKFKLSETAKIIITVYLSITLIQTVLLRISGIGWFDSLANSMSIAATGGFSTHSQSAAHFQNPLAEVIMIFFMYVSSLHFGVLYSAVKGGSLKLFRNPVIKFYTISLLIAIAVSTVALLAKGVENNFLTALRHSTFMNVATASSTGFATTQTKVWPVISLLILFYFSFMGACSGSTSGGIKADRMLLWYKSMRGVTKRKLHSSAVVRPRIGNRIIETETIVDVNQFIIFFFAIIFLGAILLSAVGMDIEDSLTTSIACVGNTGLTFGSGGAFGSYSAFPAVGKLIMTIEMFFGRLEIYPILAFIAANRWR